MEPNKVYIAGHTGLVGSAVVEHLASRGCSIVTAARKQLDLTRQEAVEEFVLMEPSCAS